MKFLRSTSAVISAATAIATLSLPTNRLRACKTATLFSVLVLSSCAATSSVPPGAPTSTPISASPAATSVPTAAVNTVPTTTKYVTSRRLEYDIVADYPHDTGAFTEGLLWYKGGFYESTGLTGHSQLRRVGFPSGKVLRKLELAPDIFAEGLVLFDDKLIQLTWQTGIAYVYDRATFKLEKTFRYSGEGWGLTADGSQLIMSNGSDTLTFRDPRTFKSLRRLKVTLNGDSIDQLNELEYIDGLIWANVWRSNFILQIDPKTGVAVSYLDLSNLSPSTGGEDVLNGIAYDSDKKRIFITGKYWPKLYEIKVK